MRVLATNCSLRGRSGTEIVTIDLALGLSGRGHEIAVFTPLIGSSADILRNRGIVVTDRPEDLPWKPDIIHGHHNHILAAALACFPEAPALFVSHSSNYWFDGPPLLPRVRRFFAVDESCRTRLIAEAGCEKEEIALLPNAVDLELFSPRAPLPARPQRALLLTKNTAHIAAVRGAAQQAGLELDEIGSPFGREVDDLHDRLGHYDLVFATARMALEALAVGCAVVVVDGRGLAGLVTLPLVDEWRSNNFGLRLLTREPTVEALVTEIDRYDARDAALVSNRIRDTASLSIYLDRVEAIHRELVATPGKLPDATADLRALGRFVAQWLRRLGEGVIPENFDTLLAANKFAGEHRAVVEENAALLAKLEVLYAQVDALNRETAMQRDILRSPLELMRLYAGTARRRLFADDR
jgi:Glycosyltransferase Family 4